jgi:hypothetical protein
VRSATLFIVLLTKFGRRRCRLRAYHVSACPRDFWSLLTARFEQPSTARVDGVDAVDAAQRATTRILLVAADVDAYVHGLCDEQPRGRMTSSNWQTRSNIAAVLFAWMIAMPPGWPVFHGFSRSRSERSRARVARDRSATAWRPSRRLHV